MNKPNQTGDASRREFLRGGARYALLTALGAAAATLVQRSGGKLTGQTCLNQGICRGCGVFADCGLPKALSVKEFHLSRSRREEAQTPKTERGVHAASTSNCEATSMRAEVCAPETI